MKQESLIACFVPLRVFCGQHCFLFYQKRDCHSSGTRRLTFRHFHLPYERAQKNPAIHLRKWRGRNREEAKN